MNELETRFREDLADWVEIEIQTQPRRFPYSKYVQSLPEKIRAGEEVIDTGGVVNKVMRDVFDDLYPEMPDIRTQVKAMGIVIRTHVPLLLNLPPRQEESSRLDDPRVARDVLQYINERTNESRAKPMPMKPTSIGSSIETCCPVWK